jgi:saccharopine dehydrogenase-like NADP-dependent oxidoreductase
MKAIILGAGNMGQSICFGMEKLGYQITLVDTSMDALKECDSRLEKDATLVSTGVNEYLQILKRVDYPDIMISSLPFYENATVAEYCIKRGIRYCDLGGNADVSRKINDLAKAKASKPVMTDLGVAPGMVNMLTEHLYRQMAKEEGKNPETVKMMVGGIPRHAQQEDYFNYYCNWSIDGLLNEYMESCDILENGEITKVEPLTEYEVFETKSLGYVEAFNTSGGASHTIETLKRLGATNVCYKTIRWPGHAKTMTLLIKKCGLDRETMRKILEKNCSLIPAEDCVMIMIAIDDKLQEILIPAEAGFSAMQRSTGFSVACAAALIGAGQYDSYKSIRYEDMSFEDFNLNMDVLIGTPKPEESQEDDNELQ